MNIIATLVLILILAVTHHITLGLLGVPPMGPYHTTEVK
jgi:hypothetical protein